MNTPRYYAALVDIGGNLRIVPGPPRDTYSGAMGVHTDHAMRNVRVSSKPDPYEPRILLDVGSIALTDETQTAKLLLDDPMLRAIYELGRRQGRLDDDMTQRIRQAGER